MTAFSDLQAKIRAARANLAAAQTAFASANRTKAAIVSQLATVSRRRTAAAAAAALKDLQAQRQRVEAQAAQSQGDVAAARSQLQKLLADNAQSLDPRANLQFLSSRYPIALLPVRVETRFVTSTDDPPKQQLWVRIYPDDCWVDTFEPDLSTSELDNAKRYWQGIWRAGGVEGDERAAWRSFVAAHGSGRANYILSIYEPLNPADQPKKVKPTDVVLVIPTQTPLAATEAAEISGYWSAVWLADGDATKTSAALATLQVAVGATGAQQLIANYVPGNFTDAPSLPLTKKDVAVSVAFLVLPADPVTQPQSWSQAPRLTVFPDVFAVFGYTGGTPVLSAVGNPITLPLYVGPDPQAAPADTIHPDDATGELVVPDPLKWLVDFPAAVAAGMGVTIDLSPDQATSGFDRLFVLGVQLSANAVDGQQALGELLQHHAQGRSGLGVLHQGTPAHNTTGNETGYSRYEDPDASFDDRKIAPLFSLTADPFQKRDGQWVAEALGVDPAVFYGVHGAGGQDQAQVRAMNQALWPATLGYWMDKLLTPVFSDDAVEHTQWFFTRFVSGRGAVPPIRIGKQPYGILPTTAFSRLKWWEQTSFFTPDQRAYMAQLYAVLRRADGDWTTMSQRASYVGKAGDPHQILLDIVGLHPNSAEFHSRFAETLQELINVASIAGFGPALLAALEVLLQVAGGMQLLKQLGYSGSQMPDILQEFFDSDASPASIIVDDRPLSETAPIRAYTDDGSNYLKWLLDAAQTSLDALRLEQGFTGNQTPQALLYLFLRHALMLGYFDTSYRLHRSAGFLSPAQLAAFKPEPPFVHVDATVTQSESRFAALYKTEPRITGAPTLLVSDYISINYKTLLEARAFEEQLSALSLLKDAPTAVLERLFVEHVDVCSYRYDSWLLGLVNAQLSALRAIGDQEKSRAGVYLGAYAWLEDVRPSSAALDPMELPADLAKVFAGPAPVMQDPANGGYIHAPSVPHARTAAVLRSGYLADASPQNASTLSVNLSSDRVRLALGILEGIRGGQSLGALLGYRFERGLHDNYPGIEVDKFIYPLRKAFPLVADAIAATKTDPGVSIEAIEARNVVDGRKLILQTQSAGGSAQYPFGATILDPANPGQPLTATPAEAAAINAEVARLLDAYDAIADLALAEGVHQAVQGNFDRIGATLDAYSTGNFPPDPEVVQSPATGIGLTHRVAVHFRSGLSAPAGATPRAISEPALDDWLQGLFPKANAIACTVIWTDPVSGANASRVVHLSDLNLRPIDVLALVRPDHAQAMTELDDRVLDVVRFLDKPRPDAALQIQYLNAPAGAVSLFGFSALVRSVRALWTRSRPLRASDALLRSDASSQTDTTAEIARSRIADALAVIAALSTDMATFVTALAALLADPVANRAAIISGIDDSLASAAALLDRAVKFGLPQSGWGFLYAWKQKVFADLIAAVSTLVTRWDGKLADFQAKITAYNALPAATVDADRFKALRAAELTVSTVLAPLPAMPAALLVTVQNKADAFKALRDQFNAITLTMDPSVATLIGAVEALLPIAAYDALPFEMDSYGDRAVVFAQDILRALKGQHAILDARRSVVQDQLTLRDNAASASARTQAMQAAGKALFGDDFALYPEFPLDAAAAGEWSNAYGAFTAGTLLKYLTQTANIDFPVAEWLAGVARVRPALHAWEATVNLATALGVAEPLLVPIQLPYEAAAPWVAMQFPSSYDLSSDRLLYTAQYPPAGFDATLAQCGMLLDEWSEVVPAKDKDADLVNRNTGITFNYNRPNSEAPQSILLVTPASDAEQWQLADLLGALNETLDLAKKRAVEPGHLDQTVYATVLPATVMATTLYGISIATALSAGNGAFTQLQRTP